MSEAMELEPHNMLTAHIMFYVLTGCQAMQQLQINISKNNTIHMLLHKQFPAIKSSDNQPTYYVTPNLKKISYIHAGGIVTDCIMRLPTDACTQHALQNEIMISAELEKLELAGRSFARDSSCSTPSRPTTRRFSRCPAPVARDAPSPSTSNAE
jgi:hypothetical protein